MALCDELSKLHALQQVDTQIFTREQAIKTMDNGDHTKQEAVTVMKRHDAVQAELRQVEAQLRDRELALKTIEQKRAVVHDKLYSGRIHNPKELGDLQLEEEMYDTQIGGMESQVLELMDQVERARAVATAAAEALSAIKRRWQDIVARYKSETTRLAAEVAALRPQRDALAATVDRFVLRRYDDLRLRHDKGIGIAMTGNDMCPVCHVKLTAQTLSRMRECEELTTCDNCGRLLVLGG